MPSSPETPSTNLSDFDVKNQTVIFNLDAVPGWLFVVSSTIVDRLI